MLMRQEIVRVQKRKTSVAIGLRGARAFIFHAGVISVLLSLGFREQRSLL